MECKKCGKTISDTAKFCRYCGEEVDVTLIENFEQTKPKKVEETADTSLEQQEKNVAEQVIVETNQVNNNPNLPKKKNTALIVSLIVAGVVIVIVIIIVCILLFLLPMIKSNADKGNNSNVDIKNEVKESEYRINGNSLEDFDLYFLQLENEKKNKIYSPLSIKYALAMLNEGADGDSKKQISNVIGDYKSKKYINSKNMSFANALFINNSQKNTVKNEYGNILMDKYNAEVKFDSFNSTDNINKWISDKTLNLINGALSDLDPETKFVLINALGIDMEWKEKFLVQKGPISYSHEKFYWSSPENVSKNKFDNNQEISGMKIIASFNNYDIVKTLGEDRIRETVGNEYRKYLKDPANQYEAEWTLNNDFSDENINKVINEYLDNYIKEINKNYKRTDITTDFSFYVDDDLKVFAKDLKKYNGTTLQYIGIMPTNESLDDFVEDSDSEDINEIIGNLNELKPENFKDGVVTKITGYIPKFKFDYELNLQDDLKELGITDIFDSKKSNLSGISSTKGTYIGKAAHKANIEFTQDGIKASAVTMMGGYGAGAFFDYLYELPVEEIDLTFNKPYMFLIRDKETGEVWFTGTVYEPLSWEEEPEKNNVW